MNVSSSTSAAASALKGVQQTQGPNKAGLQMAMLKRALSEQQQQTSLIQQQVEGKGQILDIRV